MTPTLRRKLEALAERREEIERLLADPATVADAARFRAIEEKGSVAVMADIAKNSASLPGTIPEPEIAHGRREGDGERGGKRPRSAEAQAIGVEGGIEAGGDSAGDPGDTGDLGRLMAEMQDMAHGSSTSM